MNLRDGAIGFSESVSVAESPMVFDLEQMVADAKERCHRSIGQRARWAKHDFLEAIRRPRQSDWVELAFYGNRIPYITGR